MFGIARHVDFGEGFYGKMSCVWWCFVDRVGLAEEAGYVISI